MKNKSKIMPVAILGEPTITICLAVLHIS